MKSSLTRAGLTGAIFLGLSFAANALAYSATLAQNAVSGLNLDKMGDTILGEHPVLTGEWHDQRSWTGRFCNKYWQYQISVKATLSNLDLDFNDDNSLTVTADFTDLLAEAHGALQSNATLCRPLWADAPLSSQGAHVVARVTFVGGDKIANAHVQILSTTAQHLQVAYWVPPQIDDLVTKLTNTSLQSVWQSRIGDWISDYVTKQIRNQLPQIPEII